MKIFPLFQFAQGCQQLLMSWTIQADSWQTHIAHLRNFPAWARTIVIFFSSYALAEITTSVTTSAKFWLSRKLKSIPSDNWHEIRYLQALKYGELRGASSKYVTLDAIKAQSKGPNPKERLNLFSLLANSRRS